MPVTKQKRERKKTAQAIKAEAARKKASDMRASLEKAAKDGKTVSTEQHKALTNAQAEAIREETLQRRERFEVTFGKLVLTAQRAIGRMARLAPSRTLFYRADDSEDIIAALKTATSNLAGQFEERHKSVLHLQGDGERPTFKFKPIDI